MKTISYFEAFQRLKITVIYTLPVLLIVCQAKSSFSQPPRTVELSRNGLHVSVQPETFSVSFTDKNGQSYAAGSSGFAAVVSNLAHDSVQVHWTQSGKLSVSIGLKPEYLDVSITSSDTGTFSWPVTHEQDNALTIPFYQGKYIPAGDPRWMEFLVKSGPFSGSQDLSMQFFARNFKESALLYVIKNMFNNNIRFATRSGALSLEFMHEFPATVQQKEYGFRIYLTQNSPLAIAKTYQAYIRENGGVPSLEEKAADNPNIRKLYGAPQIYMWNTEFLVPSDITNWKKFKAIFVQQVQAHGDNPSKHIFSLFGKINAEYGKEFLKEWNSFKSSGWVIKYHQELFTHALNEALEGIDFYSAPSWKNVPLGKDADEMLKKTASEVSERYRRNELLLYNAFPGLLVPVSDWGGIPLAMMDEMKAAGIKHAWVGLSDWPAGEKHPEFVEKILSEGYLIGPYDSYHSMHPPGKARWLTANFTDTSLYYNAYVMNKNGKAAEGFLGAGRKLNPTLSMPAVKDRMAEVMHDNKNRFNSWFIDCDGTGEVLDDYTPGRMTSQSQDIDARLKRMQFIRDHYKLVIGTEVGNDFSAGTVAYAHGMTTPIIAWSDPDMRKNKESPYYIGGYFSKDGGIPSRYALQAPLKEQYAYIYFDNRFNLPLFQLVYNNVEITSNHWECQTLKFPDQIRNREMKDILYNVPPLYHLDERNWNKFKKIIAAHVSVFSAVHEKAVMLEMTEFSWITPDHEVQKTRFGKDLEIIANFGKGRFVYDGHEMPGASVLIHDLQSGKYQSYIPDDPGIKK